MVGALAALALVVLLVRAREEPQRPTDARVSVPAQPPRRVQLPSRRPFAAQVLGAIAVRDRPGGRVVARLGARTEFGSRRALGVLRVRRGRWLGVAVPELENGRLGWVDARDEELRLTAVPVELEADLARRELVVRSRGRVVRRMTIGVGRSGSETPTGRFAITDKLDGPTEGPWYGCCILALSGRQPNLPEGWEGGDRLAIHGRPSDAGVGGSFSAGCLYAAEQDLRYLMERVPVGTLVTIRA